MVNANCFLENFNIERFVAGNAFQLVDSLFEAFTLGFNGGFAALTHLFSQR